MVEKKEPIRLVAIFVAAVVILAAAWVLLGGELTLWSVVMIAFLIAIAAILAIRLAGFAMAVRDI